jgi:hypothetical protein
MTEQEALRPCHLPFQKLAKLFIAGLERLYTTNFLSTRDHDTDLHTEDTVTVRVAVALSAQHPVLGGRRRQC